MQHRLLIPSLLGLTLFTAACGGDKKATSADSTSTATATATDCTDGPICVGKGKVYKAASGSAVVTVDLTGAPASAQFVLMPYLLGDTSTIQGATADKFTFTIKATTSGALHLRTPEHGSLLIPGLTDTGAIASASGYDHGKRTLLNRFDPALGLAQGEEFWRLARKLDAYGTGARLTSDGDEIGPIEAGWRSAALAAARRLATGRQPKTNALLKAPASLTTTAAGDCPTTSVTVPGDASLTPKTLTIPSGSAVDGGDYCVVYMTTPVTGGSKTDIEATIKEVVRRYKAVIYNDKFAAVGGFTFKPVVAILDFDQASTSGQWPTDEGMQISGAFIAGMTTVTNMPMIYMPANLQKLKKNKDATSWDAALQKRLWHSTIAHEANHAIMDYYRKRANTGIKETPAIDEGLAHYMEDLYGYGTENFNGFAGGFLDTWNLSLTAALDAKDDGDIIRGAAQTFWYYLISRKGGVSFSNGIVSGGDGLAFISAAVKNYKANGPANLSSQFGDDWTTAVGQYFGALVLDGSKVSGVDTPYKVQDPTTTTDLNGNTNKTYGMHFVGYMGKTATDWTKSDTALPAKTQTDGLQYYATQPFYYTVAGKASVFTFTASATVANTAVSVVRIK